MILQQFKYLHIIQTSSVHEENENQNEIGTIYKLFLITWGRIHKKILSLKQKIVSALRFGLS